MQSLFRASFKLTNSCRFSASRRIINHARSVQSDAVLFCSSAASRPERQAQGYGSNASRCNAVVTRLCKEGKLNEARKLFDELPERDVVSWTAVITGYIKLGMMEEARRLFDRADSKKNVVTWTAMVSGYLRSKKFLIAERLFKEMPVKNIVSWNTMIDGYAQNGEIDKAIELFDRMPERNTVSWNTLITALAQRGRIEEAMDLFDRMPQKDVISWTAMVAGLSKNGKIDEARQLFDQMPKRNIVSWNAMITGYSQNSRLEEAYELFMRMPERDLPSWNTMITGLIQNRDVNRAWDLFNQMPEKNVISWTTMITGYINNKQSEDALKVFSKMLADGGVKPNIGTYVSVLSACSDLAGLGEGLQIHQLICKSVHQSNELVVSALINMYSKSGELGTARKIFDEGLLNQRDLISWNGMIAAYAHHGRGAEAIALFHEMKSHGFKPDEVTYLNLLSACSHSGLVDDGMKYFEDLVNDVSLSLREDHYTCLVDLCGRAGRLKDAFDFVERLNARPSASVWGAFLAACRVHGEVDIAKEVAEKVMETEPKNAGTYMLLSNIYASRGKWTEAAKMRSKMKDKGLKKQPGCSWIHVGNQTNVFVVGDKSHSMSELISSVVCDLHVKMKKESQEDDLAAEDCLLVK